LKTPTAILADLKKKSNNDGHYRVRVGMATCGISAGAENVYKAFRSQIENHGLKDVDVISTGCVGRCDLEPMAEVTRVGEPPVLYVLLDEDKVKRIVEEHLVGGKVIEEFTAR